MHTVNFSYYKLVMLFNKEIEMASLYARGISTYVILLYTFVVIIL